MSIYFKGKDGSVAIMTLAPEANKEEAISRFLGAHGGFYIDYLEAEIDVPKDRSFRDAWTISHGNIVIDKAKASGIHLRRIREARDSKLEELDKQQLRYISYPDDKVKEIEEQKQILRDLPQNIKGLEWPDELKGE